MKDICCLDKIIELREKLVNVSYLHCPEIPDDIIGVRLEFASSPIVISVDGDDDTLQFSEKEAETDDMKTGFPWNNAIGKALRWCWSMTNNQGYQDGIQFEFANTVCDEPVIIQMIAIASKISVRIISEIDSR